MYRAVLEHDPHQQVANAGLMQVTVQINKAYEQLPRLKLALQMNPGVELHWLNYVSALLRAGQNEAARLILADAMKRGLRGDTADALEQSLKPKLSHDIRITEHAEKAKKSKKKGRVSTPLTVSPQPLPEDVTALFFLLNAGRVAEAELPARQMTERFPDYGEGWKILGTIYNSLMREREALLPLQKAVRLLPADAETHNNLGSILNNLGRHSEAETSLRTAVTLKPDYVEAYNNLGVVLKARGNLHEAESSLRRALELKPDYAFAYNNLGITLKELRRNEEAVAALLRAVELTPDFAAAHNNLGAALHESDRLEESAESYRRAVELNPDYAEAHNNLGNALKELGRFEEAEASLRRAVAIKPDFAEAHSNLLLTLNFMAHTFDMAHFNEACRYGETVTSQVASRYTAWQCESNPERLRVGVVSGDLRNHPVGHFLESVIAHLAPSRIELFAYSTYRVEDQLTSRLQPYFSGWKSLSGCDDGAAARLIHDDGVHILLDLSGHTANNRLPLFAWKPAPVQASWLGYFASTGMPEMDYLLVDETGVPPGQEGRFTEKAVYLPDTRLCFSPPQHVQEITALPAMSSGYVTFGCFQNMPKISDGVVKVWGEIFRALPTARLRVQCKQLGGSNLETEGRFIERLQQQGIQPAQVTCHGTVSREEYLASHSEVDVILDTFPYPGGTTTCEALWMGVPTLTLAGDTLLSRQGASLMTAAGLPEWVAASEAEYVAKSIAVAHDLPGLSALRMGLRDTMLKSPLCDAPRFARNLEAALWQMWSRHEKRNDD
ncbi:MAG TPA: tetratricopeptide repeat protein [Desulfuromonadales bacterium]|nr:tetratricopeptide repeat protein [Desulfuromonadales bacterium]